MVRALLAFLLLITPGPAILAQVGDSRGVTEVESGKRLDFELAPGESRRFRFISPYAGEGYFWVRGEAVDVTLELVDEAGKRLAFDDDSGMRTTAYIRRPVKKDVTYEFTVAAKPSAEPTPGTSSARLSFTAAPQDDEAMTLYRELSKILPRMQKATKDRDLEKVRTIGLEVVALLEDMPPSPRLFGITGRLVYSALELMKAHGDESALAILNVVVGDCEAILPPEHLALLSGRRSLATVIKRLGRVREACAIEEQILATHVQVAADDDKELQITRINLANSLERLGELARPAALRRKVLEIYSRILRPDDPDLHQIRGHYAISLRNMGDYERARAIEKSVIEYQEKHLPADNQQLQNSRVNHAQTLGALGEYDAARQLLIEAKRAMESTLTPDDMKILNVRSSLAEIELISGNVKAALAEFDAVRSIYEEKYPKDRLKVLSARSSVAGALSSLGRTEEAVTVRRSVVKELEAICPEESFDLQTARSGLAGVLFESGRSIEARELYEDVIAIRSRLLPPEHIDLRIARANYARVLAHSGHLLLAKRIGEENLALAEGVLNADDPGLQVMRVNHALTLFHLGDLERARDLAESALASANRTLDEGHPHLQSTRTAYAMVLHQLGNFEEARRVEERAITALARLVPEGNRNLATMRANHAVTLGRLGRFQECHDLLESVIETRAEDREDPGLATIRAEFSSALLNLGKFEEARDQLAAVLAEAESWLPPDHVWLFELTANLVRMQAVLAVARESEDSGELDRLLAGMLKNSRGVGSRMVGEFSSRAVAAAAVGRRRASGLALSHSSKEALSSGLDREILALVEELRSAPARISMLSHLSTVEEGDKRRLAERREEVARGRQLVADFLADPTLPASATEADTVGSWLAGLVRAQEAVELELGRFLAAQPSSHALTRRVELEEIAAALPESALGLSYSTYDHETVAEATAGTAPVWEIERRLVAFVLRPDGGVTRVELGPMAPIEKALRDWRETIADPGPVSATTRRAARIHSLGVDLRRRLLDPVLEILGPDCRRIILSPPPELTLISLDVLPFDDRALVGDSMSIEVVSDLEWLVRRPSRPERAPVLLALGEVDFDASAVSIADESSKKGGDSSESASPFPFLPESGPEIDAVATRFAGAFGESADRRMLRGRSAREQDFVAAAHGARFLHLATHGWFAPEVVTSVVDQEPTADAVDVVWRGYRDRLVGSEPLALCGLALSGAAAAAEGGSREGVLTGTEIAGIDLSGVELAVLSACDTHRGALRAGHGIMSLRQALQSAGVESSLTSLWKVSDRATRRLMDRFYEGIWRLGESKVQALWQAKTKLREARDEEGRALFDTRDWAGWILLGVPEQRR